LLIAAIALLVAWAGGHFWSILCFVFHQLRSSQADKDALHYQLQVLLKNTLPTTAFLWRLIQLSWYWRRSTVAVLRRIIPLAIPTALTTAAFLAAGIFSSRVADTNGSVLIRGKCGDVTQQSIKPFPQWTQSDWIAADILFIGANGFCRDNAAYARSCYYNRRPSGESDNQRSCEDYVVPLIESTVDINAACPFAQGTCKNPAIKIDSGRINSQEHLGINAPPSERVEMRKVTTCAPLSVSETHPTNWTTDMQTGTELFFPMSPANETFKYYNIGPNLLYGQTVSNWTFVVSNTSVNYATLPYTLQ
jgi:hypothetical protein